MAEYSDTMFVGRKFSTFNEFMEVIGRRKSRLNEKLVKGNGNKTVARGNATLCHTLLDEEKKNWDKRSVSFFPKCRYTEVQLYILGPEDVIIHSNE